MLFLNDWLLMTKNLQHSTEIIDVEKICTPLYGEYLDIKTFKMKPVYEGTLDEIAEKVRDWSEKPKSYRMSQFFREIGIPKMSYYTFKERNRNLQVAHDYAIQNLAERRELGALSYKLNASVVMASMCIYDEDWEKDREKKAALTNKDSKGSDGGITNVYMDGIRVSSTEDKKKDE